MSADTDKEVATAILIAILKEKVTNLEEQLDDKSKILEEHIQSNTDEITKLKQDRDSALKWGIMLLGTAVLSMGTWIFNLFTEKIKF